MNEYQKYSLDKDAFCFLKNILMSSPGCDASPALLKSNPDSISLWDIKLNNLSGGANTIYRYAQVVKKEAGILDKNFIVEVFGSGFHSKGVNATYKVREKLEKKWTKAGFILSEYDRSIYLFGHTAQKAKIIKKDQNGFYSATVESILVRGLYLPRNVKIDINDYVYIHFATIIGKADILDLDLNNKLINDFEKIDYNNIFQNNLSAWTKENFEKKNIK